MNPFELVAFVVVAVIVGRLIQTRLSHGSTPDAAATETAQLRDDMRLLKQRIQVLERVITDHHSSADLDNEIERLRDR
jgi:hypothetical protein